MSTHIFGDEPMCQICGADGPTEGDQPCLPPLPVGWTAERRGSCWHYDSTTGSFIDAHDDGAVAGVSTDVGELHVVLTHHMARIARRAP